MAHFQYLVSATLCLSIGYLAFRVLFDHASDFRQQRFFLIVTLAASLVMPLAGLRIDPGGLFEKPAVSTEVLRVSDTGNPDKVIPPAGDYGVSAYAETAVWIYCLIALAFIVAIIIHFINILRIYRLSQKSLHGNRIILSSSKVENPFSFFHWIFVPSNIRDPEEKKSIITHESIHVSQYHSIDNLLVELIAAAMWFNPLVWMMKKSFHLVHEYLADEGTLSSGVDRLRYQAFLLNRVTEESLICLPSGFNQSLIKKRMIMMTKSKNYGRNKFRILVLVPLSALLLLIVSLLNGLFPQKAQAANSGSKQPLILDASSYSGSVIQDDTLKKKTYKVKVVTPDQKVSKSKRVKVTSGSSGKDTVIYHITVNSSSNVKDTIIYIVDGKRESDVSKINPDSIESVNVIKTKKEVVITLKKHPVKTEQEIEVEVEPVEGEHEAVVEPVEGEHNVVIVKDKPTAIAEPAENEHEIVVVGKSMKKNREQITVDYGKVSFPDDVVYYIDGKKATKADVEKINPDNIESVSVLKGDGVKEAGVSEKSAGVVKIVTKKPEKK